MDQGTQTLGQIQTLSSLPTQAGGGKALPRKPAVPPSRTVSSSDMVAPDASPQTRAKVSMVTQRGHSTNPRLPLQRARSSEQESAMRFSLSGAAGQTEECHFTAGARRTTHGGSWLRGARGGMVAGHREATWLPWQTGWEARLGPGPAARQWERSRCILSAPGRAEGGWGAHRQERQLVLEGVGLQPPHKWV